MTTRVNGISIIKDDVAKVFGAITSLTQKQVLVGIPDSTTDRDDNSEITNALIGYVMETGSPANNIPARPHLVPGVTDAAPQIVPVLQAAADATLDGNKGKADQALHQAGLIGATAVKHKIDNGPFVPLKPATIRNRRRQRRTQSMRQSEKDYLALIRQGTDPQAAQDATGIQPLKNTNEYSNSITYVVRSKTD